MSSIDAFDTVYKTTEGKEYQYEYDSGERPSEAVITAVSDVAEKSPTPIAGSEEAPDALSPLYEQIDPDGLDALLAGNDDQSEDCLVTFSYDDYVVTVQAGVITVAAPE
ncbi:hypothetical protein HZS55_13805 [Halosimplex rubrum]|uniref:Halobacterial output domain-containing protein n=1 Tax=Halosimplex rubrum TaxID=869889 RepID=A0A7D5TDN7_9EURY|nr:HalOD1 output domain-containing protein [Halosimplex rubrum]QLH78316.1 hypothetical protein HZS55_13805 [Halosimplex rubrum]